MPFARFPVRYPPSPPPHYEPRQILGLVRRIKFPDFFLLNQTSYQTCNQISFGSVTVKSPGFCQYFFTVRQAVKHPAPPEVERSLPNLSQCPHSLLKVGQTRHCRLGRCASRYTCSHTYYFKLLGSIKATILHPVSCPLTVSRIRRARNHE